MDSRTSLDVLFPAASADDARALEQAIWMGKPIARSIVDQTGVKNVSSRVDSQAVGKVTHDNLINMIEVPAD